MMQALQGDPLQPRAERLYTMPALQDDPNRPKVKYLFMALDPRRGLLPLQPKAQLQFMAPALHIDPLRREVGRPFTALALRKDLYPLLVSINMPSRKRDPQDPSPIVHQNPGPIKMSAKEAEGRPRQAPDRCSALPPWTPRCLTPACSRRSDRRAPMSSST